MAKPQTKRFFVIVSQLKDHACINRELSGMLYAATASKAEIEAGKYRESLNYADLSWMGHDFHIVTMQSEASTRKLKGYTKWWKNRVTPDPTKKKGRKSNAKNNG